MWQDKMSLEKTEQNNTFRYSIFRLFFVHLSRGRVKTLLFLKNHKALTFTSQGFAMSKSCCNFRP